MNWAAFDPIATTVLYEGYCLYPYRPSALKNRQRWNFGTLYPPAFAEVAAGRESDAFVLECLITTPPGSSAPPGVAFQFCCLNPGATPDGPLEPRVSWEPTEFPATHAVTFAQRSLHLAATLEPQASGLAEPAAAVWKLRVRAANTTPLPPGADREAALDCALHAAHLRCALTPSANFISQQDPPAALAALAATCSCTGVYPVLIGVASQSDLLLATPIVLADYPRIAPESRGDYCDATEMDEMLALRVLTLAATERAEVAAAGGVGAAILARTEAEAEAALPPLHGVLRPAWDPYAAPPESVSVAGRQLRVGDRVRLRHRDRRDIFDIALAGKLARIQAIEQELDGNLQVAVIAECDPGSDLGALRQTGHRFFYSPADLEPAPNRVLVAGIGNIFLGDDAFGVEVARLLQCDPVPEGVVVRDFGIRCLDLAYCLVDGWDQVIVVDAAGRGQPPGTLLTLDISSEPAPASSDTTAVNTHAIGVEQVRSLARQLSPGAPLPPLWLVGCEPECVAENGGGLSPPVAAAVPAAIELVRQLCESSLLQVARQEGI